ncbi:MAG: hypothetical protein ACM3X9_11720 [Bacillota bacterium]
MEALRNISGSMVELLRRLVGEEAIILTEDGEKERVKIEAVIGELLVSRVNHLIKFTLIRCICSVITSCEALLAPGIEPASEN